MRNILMFVDNFDVGGVTSVVQNIYQSLNGNNISIDFTRRDTNRNKFDEEVISNGNFIYYYSDCGLNRVPIWNYKRRQLYIAKQIIKQIKSVGKVYDVIHIHANPIIGLYIGVKLHIPIRIMHVHEATPDFGDNIYKSRIAALIWKKRQKKYNKWSTVKAGDSLKACCAKYGDNILNDPKMIVLYPPVDTQRFSSERYQDFELSEYQVPTEEFNIIHVGRLAPVKNQRFMIDIVFEMNKITATNLYLIGDGEIKEELKKYAKKLGLSERVHFLPGNTTPGLYKLMRCSLLTSFSEAFGMVAVESQLMGVPCFASDAVPMEVNIGMCIFWDIEAGSAEWARKILNFRYDELHIDEKKKQKFETENLMKILRDLYI